jgi:NADP-dependent 3-hydroxy acid dehydrogenase YdfG
MPQSALIFGHTSGLGLEMSTKLLKRGYQVVGISRRTSDSAARGLVEIVADLSVEHGVEGAVETIRNRYADFDALVYCAAMLTAHEIDSLRYDTLEQIYRLNLFAPMLIESRLLDLIEQNGADVINVTSSSIHDLYPALSEYSTAKAALAKFTDDLRIRLQTSRARVVEVCPSGFTSNIYSNMSGDKIDRDETKQIKAADLAELLVYILELPKVMEVGRLYVSRKPF